MLIRILLVFGLLLSVATEAKECSKYEAFAAESVTDYLNNWHNLHLAFKQFGHCDDGAIGEGLSEAVARLLVDQWPTFSELVSYSSKEPGFEKFVLAHIDETVTSEDLVKIHEYANTRCPANAKALCQKIVAASTTSTVPVK